MKRENLIRDSIISDMAEGVVVIRSDGVIEAVNEAALTILGRTEDELAGSTLARAFFGDEENNAFIQSVLDAVYEKDRRTESYVPYRSGGKEKQLRIVSSCKRDDGEIIGVILVISDITELTEMRDAVRAMETIRELNRQLELRNRILQETFGRYLSDEVVREILDSPGGLTLGGRKQTLSILMSDLRGFTALSERMEPMDLVTMLNHYFSEMYEEIEKYHGTLIEFMGDGMLVIFGAPVRSVTHADDAVAAALGMQKRMEAVNRWNAERGFEPLGMGIGVNTDSVILGNIGSEKRTKYGVLGAAVNLVGRIESFTTQGQILISPGTLSAVSAGLRIGRTLRVRPKGVNEDILLSEVRGIGEPYGLFLPEEDLPPLRPLQRSTPVRFSALDGKKAGQSLLAGRITAISGSEAVLESAADLAAYDNVDIQIGGDLYAKVTEAENGRYRLRFTATPPCFIRWLNGILRMEEESAE